MFTDKKVQLRNKLQLNIRISRQRTEGAGDEFSCQHFPLGDRVASVLRVAVVGINAVQEVGVHPPRIAGPGGDALGRRDGAPLEVSVVDHGAS
jgi:hypothetical protein